MWWLALIPATAGVLALCVYLPAEFFFRTALSPGGKRPTGCDDRVREILERYAVFFDGAEREEVHITSDDGLRLCGYVIPGRDTHRFVILCHGYTQKAREISGPASWFSGQGYSLLLPDARGHGQSEGTVFGMGWAERRDVVGWIRFLNERYDTPDIILYGISMGGATVMMTTGEPLPPNVRAAVEDCGYTSVWDEFAYQLRHGFHLPAFPLLYVVSGMAKRRAGYSFRDASSVRQVAKSHTPTLFIHGESDTFVPFSFLREVYDAASCEKEMLTVPNAPHGLSAPTNPELYWSRVRAFLEKYTTVPG